MCVLFSYGVEVVVCSLSSLPSSHPPVSPDVFSLLFFAFFVYFIHCSQLWIYNVCIVVVALVCTVQSLKFPLLRSSTCRPNSTCRAIAPSAAPGGEPVGAGGEVVVQVMVSRLRNEDKSDDTSDTEYPSMVDGDTAGDILLLWPLLHQIRCSTSALHCSGGLASHQDTDPITMKNDFAPEHHFTITHQAHIAPVILVNQIYCSAIFQRKEAPHNVDLWPLTNGVSPEKRRCPGWWWWWWWCSAAAAGWCFIISP